MTRHGNENKSSTWPCTTKHVNKCKVCHSDMNFEFIPIYWSFSVIHDIRHSTSLHFVLDSVFFSKASLGILLFDQSFLLIERII